MKFANHSYGRDQNEIEVIGLKVNNVSAKWRNNETVRADDSLIDISFHIQNPGFCAIIGPVGSGKSTLLNAILGELSIYKGKIECYGAKIGYAAQQPWIISSTVRQNVIFNQPFDERRYQNVIANTALDVDISSWKDGDQTLVGDRGIILSGGQKARISLARCIYRDADIYLLDDPLSAVDVEVGRHIYENCIRNFLKEKIIVLVTHQVHYLKDADEILEMQNGAICSRGTFDQVMGVSKNVVASSIQQGEEKFQRLKEKRTYNEEKPNEINMGKVPHGIDIEGKRNSLMEQYTKFFAASGKPYLWSFLVISFILTQTVYSISDVFLGYWVNQEGIEETIDEDNSITNIMIFAGQIIVIVILTGYRNILHFFICLKSAENLHNKMFSKLLNTHSKFFDVHPSGRVLNRFSKDMGAVDELLPFCLFDTCVTSGGFLGLFCVTFYFKPVLIPPTLIIFIVYYYLRTYYLASSKPMKILEANTKAPIFSQLSSTFDGLATVRTSQVQQTLITEFEKKQDLHSSAYFAFTSSTLWLGLNLVLIGYAFTALCTISFLVMDGK